MGEEQGVPCLCIVVTNSNTEQIKTLELTYDVKNGIIKAPTMMWVISI